jgi:hypothetical protein
VRRQLLADDVLGQRRWIKASLLVERVLVDLAAFPLRIQQGLDVRPMRQRVRNVGEVRSDQPSREVLGDFLGNAIWLIDLGQQVVKALLLVIVNHYRSLAMLAR